MNALQHHVSDAALNATAIAIVQQQLGGAIEIVWSRWSEVDGGPVWIVTSTETEPLEPLPPTFCVVASVWTDDDADEPTAVITARELTRETAIARAWAIVTDGLPVQSGGAQ